MNSRFRIKTESRNPQLRYFDSKSSCEFSYAQVPA